MAATNVLPTLRPTRAPSADDIVTIGNAWWPQNWVRNFNPFSIQQINPIGSFVYEPLMRFEASSGKLLPWLATSYQWSPDNLRLTFSLRQGVRWSDGEPFGAQDVASTFKMLMAHPDINGSNLSGYPVVSNYPLADWLNASIAEITTPDGFTVSFRFQNVNTLGLYKLAGALIVPQHIWSALSDPKDFTNPDPVGTGPFTEVTDFEDTYVGLERIIQLERNPYYWQAGEPHIQGIRFSYRHPDYTLKDVKAGKLDMTSLDMLLDISDIQKEFLDLDPNYNKVSVRENAMNFLQLNTSHPPFDDPEVRKAISMGIDRQQIVDSVLHGYGSPPNATGLSDRFESWWSSEAVNAGSWTNFNPFQANAKLDELGYLRGADDIRRTLDGKPMVFELLTDPTYPNQDEVAQIISLNLADLGIQVTSSSSDTEWEKYWNNTYDMAIYYDCFLGPTPFDFYTCMLSPYGSPYPGAKNNLEAERYSNPRAGTLLDEITHEANPARQKALLDQVEMIFVDEAPSIPLYSYLSFTEYNTLRFTGFPTDGFSTGDVLVLLDLMPR